MTLRCSNLAEYAFSTAQIGQLDASEASHLRTLPVCCFNAASMSRLTLPSSITAIEMRWIRTTIHELNFPVRSYLCAFCLARVTKCLDFSQALGLTTLPPFLFQDARMNQVLLPPGVTTINERCFEAARIDVIGMPPELTQLGPRAFTSFATRSLDLSVASDLLILPAELFVRAMIRELKLPPVANIEIEIGEECFQQAQIESLVLPCSELCEIGDSAFSRSSISSGVDLSSALRLTFLPKRCFNACTPHIALPVSVFVLSVRNAFKTVTFGLWTWPTKR